MEYYKFALLVVFLSYIERCWSSSCVVDSFTVKDNFDRKRVCSMKFKDFKEDKSLYICNPNIKQTGWPNLVNCIL